jgi:hypothetical protein
LALAMTISVADMGFSVNQNWRRLSRSPWARR